MPQPAGVRSVVGCGGCRKRAGADGLPAVLQDTVGQRQRNLIAEHGLEAHRDWGTFLLWPQAEGAAEGDPGSFAMTHHLDGIGYKTVAERARLGLTVFDGEAAKVEAASALG